MGLHFFCRGGGGGGGRNLSDAFRGIGQICEKLSLNRVFKDRACENYKQVRVRLPFQRLGSTAPVLCDRHHAYDSGGRLMTLSWSTWQ